MNPQELTQKIMDTYNVSRPVYGNNDYVFGNDTPVFPPYERLYDVFVWLRNERLDFYEELCRALKAGTITVALEQAKDILPEEYRQWLAALIFFVALYNARNKEQTDSDKEERC